MKFGDWVYRKKKKVREKKLKKKKKYEGRDAGEEEKIERKKTLI